MSYLDTLKTACAEGRAWVKDNGIKSDAEAWAKLQRPDWMLWLAENRGVELDESKLRLFARDCAEQVLPLFERDYPEDKRPRVAIETARRFANGKATQEELAAARVAARAAAEAAARVAARVAAGAAAWDAAWAAAWAAAGEAAWAAAEAGAAAWVAAGAWAAAGEAAWAAARAAARAAAWADQADKLRSYFPNPLEGAKP